MNKFKKNTGGELRGNYHGRFGDFLLRNIRRLLQALLRAVSHEAFSRRRRNIRSVADGKIK